MTSIIMKNGIEVFRLWSFKNTFNLTYFEYCNGRLVISISAKEK